MTDQTNVALAITQLQAIDSAIGGNGSSIFASMASSIGTYIAQVENDEANLQSQIDNFSATTNALANAQTELAKLKADIAQLNTDAV